MNINSILESLRSKHFPAILWLEGEEDYFIDEITNFAESSVLSAAEAEFNVTVFYGRDADWASVVNACRRYPMFAERQVVILKEAQAMKDIELLESYVASPLATTLFVVAYKGKTIDKRGKLSKTLKLKATNFLSNKIREDKLVEWINGLVASKGLQIKPRAAQLIQNHIGNDLNRIKNEIDKLALNLGDTKEISEDSIEKYIGISKEYNVFELQAAISAKNLTKALTIINYIEQNPKAVPIQLALPALYAHFSKVHAAFSLGSTSDERLQTIFFNYNGLKQCKESMKNYGLNGIEKIILLLHHYNLKNIGINDSRTSPSDLLKEMIFKMMMQ